MKIKIWVFIISIYTITLYPQSSNINWWDFSSGYGISSNANSKVESVAGQNFIGVSGNGNTQLIGGFFYSYSNIITGVKTNHELLPERYQLYQNYPNPFNPSTIITWQQPSESHVLLKIYNILGKEVSTIVNEIKPAGKYKITFDASNLASGVYFYRLITNSFNETKKMILIR